MRFDQSMSDNNRSPRNKGRQWFCVSLLLVTVVPFILLILATLLYPVAVIVQWFASLHPELSFWRLAVFIGLIGGWHIWTEGYARWAGLNAHQSQLLAAYRWRMALWLIIIETLLIQDVLAEFVESLNSLGSWSS